jgi:hypothetical protein
LALIDPWQQAQGWARPRVLQSPHHLLALAVAGGGRFVSFDLGISIAAVPGALHLLTLS